MKLYILLFNSLLIPLSYSQHLNDTLLQNTTNATKLPPRPVITKKVTVMSEGGSIVTEVPVPRQPKINNTVLMDIEAEIGNNTKQSQVKPRKGVGNLTEEITDLPVKFLEPPISHSKTTITRPVVKLTDTAFKLNLDLHNTTVNDTVSTNSSSTATITNSTTSKPEKKTAVMQKNTTVTEIIKKPTVLSYDALANSKMENDVPILPMTKSSSVPDANQMPAPDESTMSKISHITGASGPGLVLPIVITVLVLPAFILLGYMALKRGREAWKNRHYTRMDFLLDGMYND